MIILSIVGSVAMLIEIIHLAVSILTDTQFDLAVSVVGKIEKPQPAATL